MTVTSFAHWYDLGPYLASHDLLGDMADVGACTGPWTMNMLRWGAVRVYAIDTWRHVDGAQGCRGLPQEEHDKNYQMFLKTIREYRGRVVILQGDSVRVSRFIPDASLSFAYIDACHEKSFVARDLEAYWPKMVEGGILAGHDFLNPTYGVWAAVHEFAGRHKLEIGTIPENKLDEASFWFLKPQKELSRDG